jgi:beta-lysine 5,6-aminomutase alpha subunit
MPEIATMGALERLDMMLNDSMYGIIFRNINMQRTFVDQYLSRLINARAGIVINTGEDNYLTTADAFEAGHTVVSSDFINEAFALRANLEPWQIGLGHAFEIDPAKPDQVVYQIADAQLIRQLFPGYPLKYMPPTKYMPGDIFQGHIIDGMFNFTGILTGQEIMLLGMLTEALHTPLLQDRYVSIRNAKYVFEACRHLADEISYKPSGLIERRADEQLRRAVEQLEHVRSIGLFKALQNGEFADVKRDPDGGRGFEGVIKVAPDYFNPFFAALREGRMSGPPRGTERGETTAGDSAVAGGGD